MVVAHRLGHLCTLLASNRTKDRPTRASALGPGRTQVGSGYMLRGLHPGIGNRARQYTRLETIMSFILDDSR